MALDRHGVGIEIAVRGCRRDIVVLAVEGERLVVQFERKGRHADVVARFTKAHRYRVVVLRTGYTTGESDERRVREIVLYAVHKVMRTFYRESSAIHEAVTVRFGLHVVIANRYRNAVVTVRVGLLRLTVRRLQRTVHIEIDTFDRDVRAGVVDMSGHREGRDVLEVDVIRSERTRTDEERAVLRVKLMDTFLRHEGVTRTAA